MCGLYEQICGECMGGSRGWLVVEREGERGRERERGRESSNNHDYKNK